KAATESLNRLADRIPTIPERLTKIRGDFDNLRKEQDSIQTAAELALRGADPTPTPALVKKLATIHERQQKQRAEIARPDLPAHDVRRGRLAAALAAATADLKDGLPLDVVASQA